MELLKAAMDYRKKRAIEKAISDAFQPKGVTPEPTVTDVEDNTNKTYREFAEKWLPFHARKKRFSPNSYDSYRSNLDLHILPYFGNRIMSTITSEDIDDFLDYLNQKPCQGSKSYGKRRDNVPTLSSGSVKKCYTVLTSGLSTAKKWHYINEIPETTAPSEKTKKRKAWAPEKVFSILEAIEDDKLLHLAVHIGFVCSLRAGETAGIDISTIDLNDGSLWIMAQIQRVSDKALTVLPKHEVIRVFPKQIAASKSSLILKGPKTEGSRRKQYLTKPLVEEIRERMEEIARCKDFFREKYHDYGLLICQPDGRPIDSKSLDKAFKDRQRAMGIAQEDQIEYQGLRKSGQMHKVRLSQNNYQLVAENSGQSPEVLMSNYNETLESEKRALSHMVESSFYPKSESEETTADDDMAAILRRIGQNPDLTTRLLQTLLLGAVHAQSNV